MEATRFSGLLRGLKGSNNLDYARALKFYRVFARGILSNDLTLAEMRELYEAIPYGKSDGFYDLCANKINLFQSLAEEKLSKAQSEAVLFFLNNVLKDETEKGCLASFFLVREYVSQKGYDYTHKKHYKQFLPYLKGTALCDVTMEKIGPCDIMELTLPLLELFCRLAEEADQKGLGHLIKAVHLLYKEYSGTSFVGVEVKKEGRQRLAILMDKLCDYNPVPCPEEDENNPNRNGYDHYKRFPSEIIHFLKRLKNNPDCFESQDKYRQLEEKVAAAYLKGGGSMMLVTAHLYGLDWYLRNYTAFLKKLKPEKKIKDYQGFISRTGSDKPSAEAIEAFLEAFSSRFAGNPRGILRLGVYALNLLPLDEGKQIFVKLFDLYGGKEGKNWREFTDMLLVQNYYDSACTKIKKVLIADMPEVWDRIVDCVLSQRELSGRDLDYLVQISSKLKPVQRDKIRKKLKEFSPIEDFVAWNKLYDAISVFDIPVAILKESVREKLEFIEFADNF